ncbi:hypothetical protein EDD22DRAFT_1008146, partial [Suillus occidentalis]
GKRAFAISNAVRIASTCTFCFLSSLFARSQLNIEDIELHTVTPTRSRPNALMSLLSSRFHSQHHTNEEIELLQRATRLHVVEVAPMWDREVLFVADLLVLPHQVQGLYIHAPFDCWVTSGFISATQQQQGQSQGPVLIQVSSPQTTLATLSTSMTPTVPATAPAAATV